MKKRAKQNNEQESSSHESSTQKDSNANTARNNFMEFQDPSPINGIPNNFEDKTPSMTTHTTIPKTISKSDLTISDMPSGIKERKKGSTLPPV